MKNACEVFVGQAFGLLCRGRAPSTESSHLRPMNVFLSSTGRDLKEYRDAAYKAIEGLGMHCVRMEDFHGQALPIEHFDDDWIARCELVVIILGLMRGTCLDGSDKSYTELEYDATIRLNKPYFLFPTPENFPLPGDLIENDAKREAQRRFRQRATKGLIRNSFQSPEELATNIVLAIRNWERSPDKSSQRGTVLPLPPQPYFAHPYPLQQNFTGRVRERRMLTEWLQRGSNVLSLSAIGGMGKSALTWFWVQNDLRELKETARPEGILWWSFYEEKASFGAFAREAFYYASGGQTAPDFAYELLRGLAALLSQRRLLLVLDGFERELRAYASLNAAYQKDEAPGDADLRACIDPRAGDFLEWITSVPLRSRVLITTRLHPAELDGLAGCEHKDLNALDLEDAPRA